MAEVNNAVQTLQNMWYEAVVDGLGLDKSSFTLFQSGETLPYTTGVLWQVMDAIPPNALTTVLALGSFNGFYQDYGGLFSVVITPVSDDFRGVMGDYFSDWMDYKKTITKPGPIQKAGGWPGLFEFCAGQHLPDNLATSAISVFNKDTHNIVNLTSKKYYDNSDVSNPFALNTKKNLYNIRIDDITGGAIAHGPRKEVHVNSKNSSSDVSSTWAKGGVSGFFGLFSLGNRGSSITTSKFASSEVTIDATFQHVMTIQTFKPGNWFNSIFLNYAYKGENAWSTGNPMTWANTFGPDGNLQRLIEGLVIVDGIDIIVVTSDATYTTEEQKEINTQTKGGIWPFFSASTSDNYSYRANFNDQGKRKDRHNLHLPNFLSCPPNFFIFLFLKIKPFYTLIYLK